ncbi:MAG TPA: GYD domain-containing protein [Usitatibacter sp.]|nr:GYD domain-containing protein [Usitatibacter sp.]
MATYIGLNTFTDQGIRNIKDTTSRADAVREVAKKFGVNIKEIYWTLGSVDIVTILDAPDEASVSALEFALASQGNVRTQTLRAFNKEEMKGILSKMTQAKEAIPA